MIHKPYNIPMIKDSYLEYIKNFHQIIRKGKILKKKKKKPGKDNQELLKRNF